MTQQLVLFCGDLLPLALSACWLTSTLQRCVRSPSGVPERPLLDKVDSEKSTIFRNWI